MRFSRTAILSVLAAGACALCGCECSKCDSADAKASAGMVGATKESCKDGAAGACCKTGDKASMGAVSEKKACCKGEATKN